MNSNDIKFNQKSDIADIELKELIERRLQEYATYFQRLSPEEQNLLLEEDV